MHRQFEVWRVYILFAHHFSIHSHGVGSLILHYANEVPSPSILTLQYYLAGTERTFIGDIKACLEIIIFNYLSIIFLLSKILA